MMNYSTSQFQINPSHPDSYADSEWREAERCNPKCKPLKPNPNPTKECKSPKPNPNPTEVRIEQEKETIVIHNTIHAEQLTDHRSGEKNSGTISKLAWLLFGLGSLLFLGSLMLLLAYGRSGNNNNNTKETVNNVTRTREVVRTERAGDTDIDLYFYAPRGRW
jgi:hypothetical protein